MLRMIAKRSAIFASFGKCSESRVPGTAVGIAPNSPRMSTGLRLRVPRLKLALPAVGVHEDDRFRAAKPGRLSLFVAGGRLSGSQRSEESAGPENPQKLASIRIGIPAGQPQHGILSRRK
jgi:hypothetical protein